MNLYIIDNLFFDKFNNVEQYIDAYNININDESNKKFYNDSEIIYINNGNTKYDHYYLKNEFIKIISSISDVDLNKYENVVYLNVPLFHFNELIFQLFAEKAQLPKNTAISQEGYNLNLNKEREIFSKSKSNQLCNIVNILSYIFKPDALPVFKTQSELLQHLHNNNFPYITVEFANNCHFNFQVLFTTVQEYIDFCLPINYDKGSVGNYLIQFNVETDTFKLSDFVKFIEKIHHDNPEASFDIRSNLDIDSYFKEEIVEQDGELVIKCNFNGNVNKVVIGNKNLMHYESNIINYVINLDDLHVRGYYVKNQPKYMKIYSKDYELKYKISKSDLENAKSIAVVRTMGMGDALLTLPIAKQIYDKYNKKVDFYSLYDFRDYLSDEFIAEYYKVESEQIFNDILKNYDIVLNFDLAYENQTQGNSFYDYYLEFFEDDAIDKTKRDDIILQDKVKLDARKYDVVLVGEGSGWSGKEPVIDIIELLAKTLSNKNYIVAEPGINRITHFADKTNPDQNFNELFEICKEASFYVGTDSGIAHIMNLMDKPCFIIGGAADPMKTQYNINNVYNFGRNELLCFGCRHEFKGFRTLQSGENTFIPICHNQIQYQCMDLDSELLLEELNRFLEKYDLI